MNILTKKFYTVLVVSLMCFSSLYSQEMFITGRITTTDTGESLPRANVLIKGTLRGTVSEIDGNYRIQIQPEDKILIFSYLGYESKEITIRNQTSIDVILEPVTTGLDEIVVIGYGTVRKSDLTGSVSSVRGKDLIKTSSTNPLQALQGKIAGVQIANSSGEPGADPIVRVRGVGTLNNSNPIYVVDEVIVENISFLNSGDIYSIELLKDASATAIYGSRGANGVFIVTTKQGGSNIEPQVSFRTELSLQKLPKKLDILNGREFAIALNDINPGTINNLDAVDNFDWQDAVFKNNPLMQSYDLSVAGGSDKLNYYFGAGMNDQEGIIPKSNYRRYSIKLNTKYKAREFLNISNNISAAYTDDDVAPNIVIAAYRAWPIDLPFDDNGDFTEVRGTGNPLAAINVTNNNTKTLRIVSNFYGELTFLKDFKLKTSYQLDYRNAKNRNFVPEYYVSATQQNSRNSLSIEFTEDRTWIWENTLTYNNEFGKNRLNAFVGYTMQQRFFESPNITVNRLIREDPIYWYFNAALTDTIQISKGLGDAFTNSMISYLFRTNYSYNNKYLFTASLRADGSSKFNEENRFGYFPSFALGWNVTEEPFFPDNNFINNLKVRASWGVIGNEKIGWFDRFSLIGNQYGAVFGNPEGLQPGATYISTGNDDIRWENTYQTNAGIELSALQNQLTGEIDFYRKKTDDILVMLDVPGFYGFGSFQRVRFNAASVLNQGLEFNFTWKQQLNDFSYSVSALGATIHNEVLSIAATTPSDSVIFSGALSNGKRVTVTRIGEPIGSFFGYKIQGVFQNETELDKFPSIYGQKVGDFIYKDTNGDGVITSDDRAILGSSIPDLIYGFAINLSYKGFSLGFDFNGQLGNEIYNGKNQTRFGIYNFEDRVKDRWQGEGSSNTEPALSSLAGNYETSEYFIESGSFFRLRTLMLSYEFPEEMMSNLGLKSTMIYFKATNLFTLSGYSGYSPEISGSPLSSGIDQGIYPITSYYTMGLNVSF